MIHPTYDNVLIVEAEDETVTSGGLIIQGGLDTGLKPGIVAAIGPLVEVVKPGDKVYVPWNEARPVTVEGKKGAIIAQIKILGIVG
jgi:co-chaperonin GroES (HSP10)